MSHHNHHVSGEVLAGAAFGLFLGHEISARLRATGESYPKAAAVGLGYAALGAILGLPAFALLSWGLLMHPFITIPSLFVLAWLVWWLKQPAKHQPVATASVPAPERALEAYPVAAELPYRAQRYPARDNVAPRR